MVRPSINSRSLRRKVTAASAAQGIRKTSVPEFIPSTHIVKTVLTIPRIGVAMRAQRLLRRARSGIARNTGVMAAVSSDDGSASQPAAQKM